MNEKLIHYSGAPLGTLENTPQMDGDFKPRGLWVAVGDDWKEWCEGEDFGTDRLKIAIRTSMISPKHMVELKESQASIGNAWLKAMMES